VNNTSRRQCCAGLFTPLPFTACSPFCCCRLWLPPTQSLQLLNTLSLLSPRCVGDCRHCCSCSCVRHTERSTNNLLLPVRCCLQYVVAPQPYVVAAQPQYVAAAPAPAPVVAAAPNPAPQVVQVRHTATPFPHGQTVWSSGSSAEVPIPQDGDKESTHTTSSCVAATQVPVPVPTPVPVPVPVPGPTQIVERRVEVPGPTKVITRTKTVEVSSHIPAVTLLCRCHACVLLCPVFTCLSTQALQCISHSRLSLASAHTRL
jgi:hypothetical protein